MKIFTRIICLGLLTGCVTGQVLAQDKHDHNHDHDRHDSIGLPSMLETPDAHEGHDHPEDDDHGSRDQAGEHAHQEPHDEDHGRHSESAHGDHDHEQEEAHGRHDSGHADHDNGDAHQDHDEGGTDHEGHAHGDEQGHEESDTGHEGHGHDEHGHEEGGIALTEPQRALANIRISRVEPRPMPYQIYAPGEVKANAYTSYLVSPRVDSVVLKRHVELGAHVKRGEPLVTLFSESVAEAQALYRVNRAEWQRAEKLGRKAIGEKRYVAARNDFISVKSRLKAFGLSDRAIGQLDKREPKDPGEYTLTAATAGVVLSDDFHQGQRVEAGSALMELVDETKLWVEARISGQNMQEIPRGTLALIRISENTVTARITQEAHAIDPVTRTRVLRMVVDNESHRLHPGMFADVYLQFMTDEPVVALRESALMRSADGHWVVYAEVNEDEFEAREVELGRMLGDRREVFGLKAGERIVIDGAFFVASQEAKGGFDPHNH